MRFGQWLFVFLHSIFYMCSIYKKEKVICLRPYDGKGNAKGIKIGKWEFFCENYFLLFLFIVVFVIFIMVWMLPPFVDRLPADEAYHYIDMICEDTDVDADKVIEMCEAQEMYNEVDKNYDIEAFMRFLVERLGKQMQEKGFIDEGSEPTRDVLRDRYMNAPRRKD